MIHSNFPIAATPRIAGLRPKRDLHIRAKNLDFRKSLFSESPLKKPRLIRGPDNSYNDLGKPLAKPRGGGGVLRRYLGDQSPPKANGVAAMTIRKRRPYPLIAPAVIPFVRCFCKKM